MCTHAVAAAAAFSLFSRIICACVWEGGERRSRARLSVCMRARQSVIGYWSMNFSSGDDRLHDVYVYMCVVYHRVALYL